MNTDDVCCLGLAVDIDRISNQQVVGCNKSLNKSNKTRQVIIRNDIIKLAYPTRPLERDCACETQLFPFFMQV